MKRIAMLVLAGSMAGCNQTAPEPGLGDASASAGQDAGLLGVDGSASTTCADVAADLCAKAGACANDGKAPVLIVPTDEKIVYESVAYCTSIFTNQCGPSAPATDFPLISDPAACAQALAGALCSESALSLPAACSGQH